MKTKTIAILLSATLLFTGCASKNPNLDNPAQTEKNSDVRESSIGEKIIVGTLLAGAGALFLTTAAVVILLLMPKAQGQRP